MDIGIDTFFDWTYLGDTSRIKGEMIHVKQDQETIVITKNEQIKQELGNVIKGERKHGLETYHGYRATTYHDL